jgi:transcriptional regulator with XRE-family HTH domain
MPVFSVPASDYRSLRLGQSIRERRQEKGWTLRDLSSRLELPIASLSAIENDRVVLDALRLVAIADALGVRPDALFPRSRSCHYHIVRRFEFDSIPAVALPITEEGGRTTTDLHRLMRPLAFQFIGKHMEPYRVEVPLIGENELQYLSHHLEEFFFVLHDEVELRVKTPDGLVIEPLGPGDCAYFRSQLPHAIRSIGARPAETISLLYSGYGTTDTEFGNATVQPADGPPGDFTKQIAHRIRALRQAEGVAIGDLARHLRIGLRRWKEIEQGRRVPSIHLLLRICLRFRRPIEYFLAATFTERPSLFVQRVADIARLPVQTRRRLVDRGWAETQFRSLASGFGPRGMYPYYVKLRYPGEPDITLHEHHGQEFVYVLNGEVTLLTVREGEHVEQRLSAGDVCFLDSTVPHRFLGKGLSPYDSSSAELIDVFWCPLGEGYLFADDEASHTAARQPDPERQVETTGS